MFLCCVRMLVLTGPFSLSPVLLSAPILSWFFQRKSSLFFFVICNFYWTQSRKKSLCPCRHGQRKWEGEMSLRRRSHLMLLAKDRAFLLSCPLPPTCSQFSSLLPPEGPHLLINSAAFPCLLLHAQKDTCFPACRRNHPSLLLAGLPVLMITAGPCLFIYKPLGWVPHTYQLSHSHHDSWRRGLLYVPITTKAWLRGVCNLPQSHSCWPPRQNTSPSRAMELFMSTAEAAELRWTLFASLSLNELKQQLANYSLQTISSHCLFL